VTYYEEENRRCEQTTKDVEYSKDIDEAYSKITGEFFKM
jgi:hypothetical protein